RDDGLGTTRAYIQDATIARTTLDVTADPGGFIGSLTAGAAGASGRQGIAVTGSVSVDVVLPDTEAYVTGAQLTLAGDSEVTATDNSEIWSVAGNGALGGQGGYGGAVAVNLIGTANQPAKTLAYVTDSTVTLAGGTLSVLATDANAAALPSIVSIAGSLGVGTQLNSDAGAGMVAVNFIDAETDAYVQDSTIQQPSSGATAANL